MRQLYEIGEEALLRSQGLPHLNGEYIVRSVAQYGERYVCRLTGAKVRCIPKSGDNFTYILEGVITETEINGSTYENTWKYTALRKKHHPSGLSFTSLMDSLKSPVLEWK